MSARLSPGRIVVAAICTVILLGIAAGRDMASRGELVVLHLGGRP